MSLSRIFYVDMDKKELVKSFENSSNITTPVFYQGDKSDIDIILLQSTGNTATPYINYEVTTENFTLGLGRIDQKPTSGTYTLSFGGDTTTALSFNADATTIQTALNLLASIVSAGGVTVTGLDPFKVVFNNNGARAYITADVTLTTPVSVLHNTRIQTGDGSTKEIQVLRVRESLVAVTNSFSSIPTPSILVTREVTGGSGLNEVQRVEISQICQGGTINLTFGGDSASFVYKATGADVQTALEALPGFGVGNVSVTKINDLIYNITFIGTLADATQTLITANASGLLGFSGFRGSLDLTSYAVDELLNGSSSISTNVFFEGELAITGDKTTVFRKNCAVNNDAISDATTSPPLVSGINWGNTVFGPASAADENIAFFDGTTGKLIQDLGINKSVIDGHSTKLGFITVTQALDLDTIESDLSGAKTKTDFLTVTQAVDLDIMESDIATNNAKVTNANHTGDATGSTALTLASVAITGKTSATPVSGDKFIFSDTSDFGNLKSCDFDDLGGGSWTELAHVQYNSTGVTSFEEDFDCSAYNVVRIKGVIRCATVATAYHTLNINLKLSGVEKVADYIGKTVSPSLSTDTSSTTRFPLAYCRVTTTNKILFTFDIELIKNSQGIDYNAAVSGSTEDAQVYRNYLAAGRLNDTAENLDGLIFRCFQSVNRDLDFADFKIYGGDYASV